MKIHPMIFNSEMVKALVDGKKTVTRRPIEKWRKPRLTIDSADYPDSQWISTAQKHHRYGFGVFGATEEAVMDNYNDDYSSCATYQVDDLIWVRETFCVGRFDESDAEHPDDRELFIDQCKDEFERYIPRQFAIEQGANIEEVTWKPSIHMPRPASRLTLRVTNVRCERIQDITDDSAVKEGMPSNEQAQELAINAGLTWFEKSRVWYKNLWNRIYKNWDENPWVWVIEFEVIHKNIDQVIREEKQ